MLRKFQEKNLQKLNHETQVEFEELFETFPIDLLEQPLENFL